MKYAYLLILALFLTASSIDDGRRANKAFENGNYARAAELYRQAIEEDPENARLHFNLASALYKLGRSEEAMESYKRFEDLSKSPEEQSYASYNQGTILTDEDKYQEAAEYFREALKKNPNDPDARHNYELALQRQQQKEQEQQQQQNQDSGENDEQDQDQQQQNNNEDQNQDQNQQPPNSGQQDQPQNQNEQRQPQPQPTEMTPQEAENILDALAQLERELLENMKKESSETTPSRNAKDW